MRRVLAVAVLAGCMSAGSLFADEVAVKPGKTDLPAGITAKELNDQQDVRAILAQVANAAVTKGGFDDLTERLSSADRKRIGDFPNQEFAELDGRIAQIQKIWNEKYGNKFDLNNDKILESFVVIREGEITDPAVAKAHWPLAAVHDDKKADDAQVASAKTAAASAEYLEKGRNVAIVNIPESHGYPAMRVSMLHETVDDWRIDIPDTIGGQQVYNNLMTALTSFGENVTEWPADENEAYRALTHKVLAALYNVTPAEAAKPVRIGD